MSLSIVTLGEIFVFVTFAQICMYESVCVCLMPTLQVYGLTTWIQFNLICQRSPYSWHTLHIMCARLGIISVSIAVSYVYTSKAVNKLAEIMNRKEGVRGSHRVSSVDTDVHRKEKENRKLQLQLRSEREKLNSTIIKYQKEINDMQAVSINTPTSKHAVHWPMRVGAPVKGRL